MDFSHLFRDLEEFQKRGDLDSQIDVLRQLLSIAQQTNNQIGEITTLRSLGNVYQEKGQLKKAHSYRLLASSLAENPKTNCPQELKMLIEGDLGRSFIEVMDWGPAEEHTSKALVFASTTHDIQAECIYKINLQAIYINTSRSERTYQLANEVLKTAENLVVEDEKQKHYIQGLQHLNLGIFLNSELRLNECQKHARQAFAHAESAQNPSLQIQARKLLGESLSRAKFLLGRPEYFTEAEKYFSEVLAFSKKSGNTFTQYNAEFELARLYENQKDIQKASEHYEKSLDLLEEVRSSLGYEEFQKNFFRNFERTYSNAASFFLKQNRSDVAFLTTERFRSRLLLMLLGQGTLNRISWSDEQKKRLLDTLDKYGSQAVREVFGDGMRGKKRGTTFKAISEEKSYYTKGEVDLNKSRLEFIKLFDANKAYQIDWQNRQSIPVVTVNQVQKSLGPKDALISYWVSEKDIIIFVLTRNKFHFQHLSYSSQNLSRDIEIICNNINMMQDEVLSVFNEKAWFSRKRHDRMPDSIKALQNNLDRNLEKIYSILIAPIIPIIKDQYHWLIVPNGALHRLPWAALRAQGRYIVEEHSVSLLPSASIGMSLKERPGSKNMEALFFADPDSDDPKINLPASQEEVKAGQKIFGKKTKAYIGKAATKQALLNHIGAARLIHIASHHIFDAGAPLLSFIKLAGKSGQGFLYAFEVAEMKLNCDLITLSACQSGRSHISSGDEQYGLVSAFLTAGASSVISTLWSIEDESASFFFAKFYEYTSNTNLAEALASAQRALLVDPRFCLPCFWAPYVLSGKWDNNISL